MTKKITFEEWRATRPGRSFKDFFLEDLQSKWATGRPHPTLGANLAKKRFGEDAEFLGKLVGYGLEPDHVCVDYGCGTLRIGVHVISYLERDRYWGLDIGDLVLDEGKILIGDKLIAEKRPRLRVISPECVAEVAAVKPALLFSVRVLQHVHPEDIAEFFENVVTIIGASGQAIIRSRLSEEETVRYGDKNWAHSAAVIRGLLSGLDAEMVVVREIRKPKRQSTDSDERKTVEFCIARIGHPALEGAKRVLAKSNF